MNRLIRRMKYVWIIPLLGLGLWSRPVAAQPAPGELPAPQADAPPPGVPGQPEPGYLGIVGDDRQENGAGIRVIEIEAGGPAETGGLKEDDLITAIGGKAIHSTADMSSVLQPLPRGSKVTFEVQRNGTKQAVTVTLGRRPPAGARRFERFGRVPEESLPDPNAGGPGAQPKVPSDTGLPGLRNPGGANPDNSAPQEPPGILSPSGVRHGGLPPSSLVTPGPAAARRQLLGVRTQPVTEEIRRQLHLPNVGGAWVVQRVLGSPAEKAGIPLDAVIVAVGDTRVDAPEQLARLVTEAGAGKAVQITYFSAGELHRVNLVLGDAAATTSAALPSEVPPGAPPSLPLPPPANPPVEAQRETAPRAVPPLPVPSHAKAPADERSRLDTLERRVEELEQRVRDLEQAQKK